MPRERSIDFASRSSQSDVFEELEHCVRIELVGRDIAQHCAHLGEGRAARDLVHGHEDEGSVRGINGQLIAETHHPVAVDGVPHRVRTTV